MSITDWIILVLNLVTIGCCIGNTDLANPASQVEPKILISGLDAEFGVQRLQALIDFNQLEVSRILCAHQSCIQCEWLGQGVCAQGRARKNHQHQQGMLQRGKFQSRVSIGNVSMGSVATVKTVRVSSWVSDTAGYRLLFFFMRL